ncbi:sigma-70 family RNA polymerase sigma factor [Pantoea sp. 18069]|uniref:sigma-70 family RNA polymerase sigma factor n=1 Tax=Pantoea sp. 18069 TaxID=2681415 RepID=UPI00190F8935|nr:sigma-70 family RNA polymerase sigma factor [Pantoea sp. 18069]
MSSTPMPAADAAAAAALFTAHQPWLLDRLRKRLRDAAEAEDVSSETFLRVMGYKRLHAMHEPRAYLTTIAKNILTETWRRRDLERAWMDALAALPQACAPSPEERAVLRESLEAIANALERLPAKARTAFLLSQLDGLTYAEIAQRIGMSERMVRRYMADGLRCCMLALQS